MWFAKSWSNSDLVKITDEDHIGVLAVNTLNKLKPVLYNHLALWPYFIFLTTFTVPMYHFILKFSCVLWPPVIYDQNHRNQKAVTLVVKHRFHCFVSIYLSRITTRWHQHFDLYWQVALKFRFMERCCIGTIQNGHVKLKVSISDNVSLTNVWVFPQRFWYKS